MTSFRLHNTHIALSQGNKTGITITLIKTFLNRSTAMHTPNITRKSKFDSLTNQWIQSNTLIAQWQFVLYRVFQARVHFV
jgi:hypothetical protein